MHFTRDLPPRARKCWLAEGGVFFSLPSPSSGLPS